MNFYLSFVAGFILMLIVACVVVWIVLRGKNRGIKRADIVGTWGGRNQTAKIFENGKIILTNRRWGKRTTGTYEFMDKNLIRIMLDGSDIQDFRVSLSRNKLFVKSLDGTITKYHRTHERDI